MNDKTYNEIVARNIKHYLNINDMSQAELAKRLNVSSQSITNWCKGTKTPRMDKVQQIAEIFGVLVSDIVEDRTNISSSIVVRLSSEEYHLFKLYDNLNDTGKAKLKSYIDDLVSNPANTEAAQKKEA